MKLKSVALMTSALVVFATLFIAGFLLWYYQRGKVVTAFEFSLPWSLRDPYKSTSQTYLAIVRERTWSCTADIYDSVDGRTIDVRRALFGVRVESPFVASIPAICVHKSSELPKAFYPDKMNQKTENSAIVFHENVSGYAKTLRTVVLYFDRGQVLDGSAFVWEPQLVVPSH